MFLVKKKQKNKQPKTEVQNHIYASNLELVQDYCILVLIFQDFVGNMAMH